MNVNEVFWSGRPLDNEQLIAVWDLHGSWFQNCEIRLFYIIRQMCALK